MEELDGEKFKSFDRGVAYGKKKAKEELIEILNDTADHLVFDEADYIADNNTKFDREMMFQIGVRRLESDIEEKLVDGEESG